MPSFSPVLSLENTGPELTVVAQGLRREAYATRRLRESWAVDPKSVPIARCERCARRLAMTFGEDHRARSVTCAEAVPELASCPSPRKLPKLTVGDVMLRSVLCVRPELPLDTVTELFLETGLS